MELSSELMMAHQWAREVVYKESERFRRYGLVSEVSDEVDRAPFAVVNPALMMRAVGIVPGMAMSGSSLSVVLVWWLSS